MKKRDINRLKKVVLHYRRIEEILQKVSESIWESDSEYIKSIDGNSTTTYSIVMYMWKEASSERKYTESRIQLFEEL